MHDDRETSQKFKEGDKHLFLGGYGIGEPLNQVPPAAFVIDASD